MAILQPFNRVQSFTVSCPAGTAATSPREVDTSFDPGVVVGVELVIPDGHSGLTGIAIAAAHQPVLPFTHGQWIISNDEKIEWPLDDQTNTGDWSAFVYNTDRFAHSWQVRFLVSDFGAGGIAVSAVPAPLELA